MKNYDAPSIPAHDLDTTCSQEVESNKVIEDILEEDKANFEKWRLISENYRKLNLPNEALRHVLITRKVLEKAVNPKKVRLIIDRANRKQVRAYVVETRDDYVTTPEAFNNYLKLRAEHIKKIRAGVLRFTDLPQTPKDVDELHADELLQIQEGKIDLRDFIFQAICFRANNPETIFVSSYGDNVAIRHQKVGTEFYEHFAACLKKIGFRFILGENNPSNITFYLNVLGRVRLLDVKNELMGILGYTYRTPKSNEMYTVQFLYPEDKELYALPAYTH